MYYIILWCTVIYWLVRNYSKINWSQLKVELYQDPLISLAKTSEDPDVITSSIIDAVNNNLDNQESIKRIQNSSKSPPFISPETRKIISKRDLVLMRSKQTKNDNDIWHVKTLINCIHKMIAKDNRVSLTKKFKEVENNPQKLW